MIRRVLVTLDGSTFAEAALPPAVALARRSGAELRLLVAHDPTWAFADHEAQAGARARALAYLALKQEPIGATDLQVTPVLRDGQVVRTVLEEAKEWNADLIVMATHGRGPVSRFWLGSVADQCVRHSHRPVLLLRPPEDGSLGKEGGWSVRRVVIPVDGSQLAETALDAGLDIADYFGAPIDLLRVVGRVELPATPFLPEAVAMSSEMFEAERVAAEEYVEQLSEKLRSSGTESSKRVVIADRVAHAILEHAGSDLIVIATHARLGVNRAVLGSVADQVVRGATGPVLVVPPQDGSQDNEEQALRADRPSTMTTGA